MRTRSEPDFRFYGRRKGRPLSPARCDTLKTVLSKFTFPTKFSCLETLFEVPVQEIHLETGFGNGVHLAAQALANPSIGFIGAEIFMNGLSALANIIHQKNIKNILIFPDDARVLLQLLPDQSLSCCFCLFPDPWPKARHHKRRFIQPDTLDQLARLLKDGARLSLATDDPGLKGWMLEQCRNHLAFEWTARSRKDWETPPPGWTSTRYEQKALKAGRKPAYLIFVRKTRNHPTSAATNH